MMIFKVDKVYDDYFQFYEENHIQIYQRIISIFEEMSENGGDSGELNMEVKSINNFFYATTIKFETKDDKMLREHLLPYFEKIEDYETCHKIKKLIETINKE